ncbi:hypothetical protein Thermo_00263 [Thermoplasmatales archaeon]|nr:hypothetical protein Thermo_00263 [Thermoplasmatales archaeon]
MNTMLPLGEAEKKAFLLQFWKKSKLEPLPDEVSSLLEFFLEESITFGNTGMNSLEVAALAAVFAVTDALETNDLINHPNGPSFTMYDEFGVDFTNTPAWEFWVRPPNIGFYGEFGVEVGISYSGAGANFYYPAITSYLIPETHTTFMPYYQPPWY